MLKVTLHSCVQRREAVAKQLLSKSAAATTPGAAKAAGGGAIFTSGNGKIVYRHLRDGDLMLTNRQPTLHKPGLMAHRARVLKVPPSLHRHVLKASSVRLKIAPPLGC